MVINEVIFNDLHLPERDRQCVQGPEPYSPKHQLTSITIHSSFMYSSCRKQLELWERLLIGVNLSLLHRSVIPIVAHL